jgi:hypothetical protein
VQFRRGYLRRGQACDGYSFSDTTSLSLYAIAVEEQVQWQEIVDLFPNLTVLTLLDVSTPFLILPPALLSLTCHISGTFDFCEGFVDGLSALHHLRKLDIGQQAARAWLFRAADERLLPESLEWLIVHFLPDSDPTGLLFQALHETLSTLPVLVRLEAVVRQTRLCHQAAREEACEKRGIATSLAVRQPGINSEQCVSFCQVRPTS